MEQKVQTVLGKVHTWNYASMSDFMAEIPDGNSHWANYNDTHWTKSKAPETYAEALRRTFEGRESGVEMARGIIEQLEAEGIIGGTRPAWARDVAGDFPCVPSYLAGDPMAMYRRAMVASPSENSPIRVFASVTCGYTLNDEHMQKRGAAILALVMALQSTRPVDLVIYSLLDRGASRHEANLYAIEMDTRPLDTQALSYVLASGSWSRKIGFTWCRINGRGFTGAYAFGKSPSSDEGRRAEREALGATDLDIVIHTTANDERQIEPVAWVKRELERHKLACALAA